MLPNWCRNVAGMHYADRSTSDTLGISAFLQSKRAFTPMKRQKVALAGVSFAGLVVVAITSVGHLEAATANPAPTPASVLIDAMESELHRAMTSLGNSATDATQQPKPYFLSYAVADLTKPDGWTEAAVQIRHSMR